MNCQFPQCGKKAIIRLEVDHLTDDRRIVGFDEVAGKITLAYYCRGHFWGEVEDWIAARDAKRAS